MPCAVVCGCAAGGGVEVRRSGGGLPGVQAAGGFGWVAAPKCFGLGIEQGTCVG